MNSFSTKRKKKTNWRDALNDIDASGSARLSAGQHAEAEKPVSKFAEWHDQMDGKVKPSSADDDSAAAAAARNRARSPPLPPQPNPWVFMEIGIGADYPQRSLGRLEIELFADVVPKTAENFKQLCVGDHVSQFTGNSNLPLCFAHNTFHRIITGFMAQGGDITREDGTGGESIYGRKFNDENFLLQHTGPGMLSMANSGRHTNNSQFFLTFVRTPHLDQKHVVFGQVKGRDGLAMLKEIEALAGSKDGEPRERVTVLSCGLLDKNESAGSERDDSRGRDRGRDRERDRSRDRSRRSRSRSRSRNRSRSR